MTVEFNRGEHTLLTCILKKNVKLIFYFSLYFLKHFLSYKIVLIIMKNDIIGKSKKLTLFSVHVSEAC